MSDCCGSVLPEDCKGKQSSYNNYDVDADNLPSQFLIGKYQGPIEQKEYRIRGSDQAD